MPTARSRPRDRKAQIARAAADAFSASGFHAVSMGDIATRVGVSASALYRHAPGKYELFRDVVLAVGQQLVEATDFVEDELDDDPTALRDRVLTALIEVSIANRSSSGLYRWEGRYLEDADRARLIHQLKLVNRRLHRPLAGLRPNLTSAQRWTLSTTALSVIGSIADHHGKLGSTQIRALLLNLTIHAFEAELPAAPVGDEPPPPVGVAATKYEAILQESLKLFHVRGYRETAVEDIAAAVGMPTSGIYRYFAGKSDILAASFRRAADRVSADLSDALTAPCEPAATVNQLVDSYVARSFDNPELAYLYYTDRSNLPPADARILHNIQCATVDRWADLVTSTRPDIGAAEARFVVHAAFALVVDLGRLTGYDDAAGARDKVRTLMRVILLGAESPYAPAQTPESRIALP